MKKSQVIAAIGILFAMNALSLADVILPGTHPVQCCTKIVNSGGFPDIIVIGYIRAVNGSTDRYVANQDSCLTKGYKFNGFYLLWTPKSYFDSVGLANLPIDDFIKGLGKKTSGAADSRLHLFTNSLTIGSYIVPDSNTLISVEGAYKLYVNGSNISLYLSEQTSHFSDNTQKTETFPQPTGVKPSQGRVVRNGAIENIFIKNGIFAFKTEFAEKLEMLICDCKGRTMGKYLKSCIPGCTYVTQFTGLKSGLYWLRLKSPTVVTTKQLTIIR
jgi:hypothetical protein